MPSDSALAGVDWTRRSEPDELPEWMDEPCSYAELRACLRDLGKVNRLTRGYRPTIAFLDQVVSRMNPPAPLRILDVGCGGGDALHRVALWAKHRGVTVELTGIDLNPMAVRAAAESYPHASIDWQIGDALAFTGEADVIISSLLTHHLATDEVVHFLRWMETKARFGWFINDLERSRRSASLFSMLSRVMRWHRFVRHDGPVSFARSFVTSDWERMLSRANIAPNNVEITQAFPSRLCVSRIR